MPQWMKTGRSLDYEAAAGERSQPRMQIDTPVTGKGRDLHCIATT